jgi:hypothetical protein
MARPNPVDPLNFTNQAARDLVTLLNRTNQDLEQAETKNKKTDTKEKNAALDEETRDLRIARLEAKVRAIEAQLDN